MTKPTGKREEMREKDKERKEVRARKELLYEIYGSAKIITNRILLETEATFTISAGRDSINIIARLLIIIGEAATLLLKKHKDFCLQHPELNLKKYVQSKNTLVHDFNRVDWVWRFVHKELPKLIQALDLILFNYTNDKKTSSHLTPELKKEADCLSP
jgi:uncharacterized protein with HEPN domain